MRMAGRGADSMAQQSRPNRMQSFFWSFEIPVGLALTLLLVVIDRTVIVTFRTWKQQSFRMFYVNVDSTPIFIKLYGIYIPRFVDI